MKRALAATLLVALSLTPRPAPAAEELRGRVREVSSLLEIPRGLELASAKVQKGFQVEGSPEAQAKAQAILKEVFASARLRLVVEGALTESADSATLGEAIRFLTSPLARKLSV